MLSPNYTSRICTASTHLSCQPQRAQVPLGASSRKARHHSNAIPAASEIIVSITQAVQDRPEPKPAPGMEEEIKQACPLLAPGAGLMLPKSLQKLSR